MSHKDTSKGRSFLSHFSLKNSVAIAVLSATTWTGGVVFAHTASPHQPLVPFDQKTQVYKAYFPSEQVARQVVKSMNTFSSHYEQGYLIVPGDSQQLNKLIGLGFKLEAVTAKDSGLNLAPAAVMDEWADHIPGYSCYPTVEATFKEAKALAEEYPRLAEWIDIGDSWRKTQQRGGYDMMVLKLTRNNSLEDKPKLFINSAIHAREYATAPLALAFAKNLLTGYGSDADATWILDHHEVHLLLQANPDGRKQAEKGVLWRKNVNDLNSCYNPLKQGIDLNRNFTFGWGSTTDGSSGDICSQVYRGEAPGSEPEVQALQNYVRSLYPDRRGPERNDPAPLDTSGIHLDIHSHGRLILWPWGTKGDPAPNHLQLQTLGRKFAYFNSYSPERSLGLYETDGTSDGISYGELGVAAFTFELGTEFFESCHYFEQKIVPDNMQALRYAAKVVRAPYQLPAGPEVYSVTISNQDPVPAGTWLTLSAIADDSRFSHRNGAEPVQTITAAEYYLDIPPWQEGAERHPMQSVSGDFNLEQQAIKGIVDTRNLSSGKHMAYIRAMDSEGRWGPVTAVFFSIQ
ncbi:M14 family metallopeptidase [Zooshikella ganghwensis]|uniref:Carboxypeptidase n=1 Tax=Zooshikella ganghwensis TaxID=202772 RepID=A0A4P9VN80_9GAMM|nr:M14 family metallopeptidase [Zooshikella ganghwensis]RDH43392.1 carboxypeptidase [Zooshikella ganghwensis]